MKKGSATNSGTPGKLHSSWFKGMADQLGRKKIGRLLMCWTLRSVTLCSGIETSCRTGLEPPFVEQAHSSMIRIELE
jgi:hypothetical protein